MTTVKLGGRNSRNPCAASDNSPSAAAAKLGFDTMEPSAASRTAGRGAERALAMVTGVRGTGGRRPEQTAAMSSRSRRTEGQLIRAICGAWEAIAAAVRGTTMGKNLRRGRDLVWPRELGRLKTKRPTRAPEPGRSPERDKGYVVRI